MGEQIKCRGYPLPECVMQYILDAVGKTTPATPKNIRHYRSYGFVSKYQIGVCPICGYSVYSSQRYCHQCGQRLEWEDLEEEKNE